MSTNTMSLRTLAESKTEGITKSTTFRVDPKLIHLEEGFNLRDDNDELQLHIDRLYEAMRQGAFIPPVDVQIDDKGCIVARDGHCRTKAAIRIRKEMPEYTLECRQLRGNDADAIMHMLGTGSGQKPLTPLEQGRGFLRLANMGMTQQAIAEKLGISVVTVGNNLTLAEAPLEVQTMIANGQVSSTTAREVVKQGVAAIEALKAEVAKGGEGKKKRVTKKRLRGTAASPKKAKPKKEKKQTIDKWNKELDKNVSPESPESEKAKYTKAEFMFLDDAHENKNYSDRITVSLTKEEASILLEILSVREHPLTELVSTLQMGLM